MAETQAATAPAVQQRSLSRWLAVLIASSFGEFVVFDVVISLVVGLVVWFADRSEIGILAFFLSLIFLLIIKLYGEIVKMHHDYEASLHQEYEKIQGVRTDVLKIIDVDHALLSDPVFSKYVSEILKNYSTLLKDNDPWFLDRAKVVLKECSQEMTRLKSGEIYHGQYSNLLPNFYAILQQQLSATKKSAFFTSDVKTDFSWSGNEGKPYRALNIQCAKSDIQITRIFIVNDLAVVKQKDVLALINEQLDAGIHIRIALSSRLGRDSLYDMGIYDERYVSYFDLTPDTHEIRAHRTLNTPEALEQAIEIRERLIRNSDEAHAVLAGI